MGIYDRDYVRREGPSFLGSFVERGFIDRETYTTIDRERAERLTGTAIVGSAWWT